MDATDFVRKVFSFLNTSLIVFLGILLFIPSLSEINAIKIITLISVITYSVVSVIFSLFFILSLVVLFLFAFTNSIKKINMKIPENKTKHIFSSIMNYIKNIVIFILASKTNYNLVAIITAILIFIKIILEFLLPSVKTKIALLTLAEESKNE